MARRGKSVAERQLAMLAGKRVEEGPPRGARGAYPFRDHRTMVDIEGAG